MLVPSVTAERCQQMMLEAHDSMQEEQVEKLDYTQQGRTDDVSKHDDVLQQYNSFQIETIPLEKPWSQDAKV